MSDIKNMSKQELVNKFEELTENKENARSSDHYDYYCEQTAQMKKEILSRMI